MESVLTGEEIREGLASSRYLFAGMVSRYDIVGVGVRRFTEYRGRGLRRPINGVQESVHALHLAEGSMRGALSCEPKGAVAVVAGFAYRRSRFK